MSLKKFLKHILHISHLIDLICGGIILLWQQLNARMNKLKHEVLQFFGMELHAVN